MKKFEAKPSEGYGPDTIAVYNEAGEILFWIDKERIDELIEALTPFTDTDWGYTYHHEEIAGPPEVDLGPYEPGGMFGDGKK